MSAFEYKADVQTATPNVRYRGHSAISGSEIQFIEPWLRQDASA